MLKLLLLFAAALSGKAEAPANPERNLLCLEANIYFEAGSEAWKGKLAVKDVTLNRGGAVCKTVFTRNLFSWTHQRSWKQIEGFLLDKVSLSKLEAKAWEQAKKAASSTEVVLDKGYRHYHHTNISPFWTKEGLVIGNHKFVKGVK